MDINLFLKKREEKIGLQPGALVFVGEEKHESVEIEKVEYSPEHYTACVLKNIDEAFPFSNDTITWLNINGVNNFSIIETIGNKLSIHPLVLEDIVNTDQRTKTESYDDFIFVIMKIVNINKDKDEMFAQQISLIIGKNYVVSFLEEKSAAFNILKDRIAQAKGRIRKAGADYLGYALMDVVVDNYFLVLEQIADTIESLEMEVIKDTNNYMRSDFYRIKRKLLYLRKSIWPLREEINSVMDNDSIMQQTTMPYLRDLYDHTIRIIETIESFRDMASGLLDVYISNVSNRMNEVMKTLTTIATIFIPITFIAGVYGMNFEHMPELKWSYSYPIIWAVFILCSIGMLFFFKRKKWF